MYKKKYGVNVTSNQNGSKTKCFKGFGNLLNNMDDKERIKVIKINETYSVLISD